MSLPEQPADSYRTSYGAGKPQRHDATNFTCQRCLKRGHFTYDCTSSDSAYNARPTATSRLNDRYQGVKTRDIVNVLPPTASAQMVRVVYLRSRVSDLSL
jgi:hypothetical protein